MLALLAVTKMAGLALCKTIPKRKVSIPIRRIIISTHSHSEHNNVKSPVAHNLEEIVPHVRIEN